MLENQTDQKSKFNLKHEIFMELNKTVMIIVKGGQACDHRGGQTYCFRRERKRDIHK